MKRNNPYLWLFAMVFLTVFTGCQKDDEIVPHQQNDAEHIENRLTRTQIDFKTFKSKISDPKVLADIERKMFKNTPKSGGTNDFILYIDTSRIIEYSNDSITTYTMTVITSDQDTEKFTNIVLKEDKGVVTTYLLRYTPTEQWKEDALNGNKGPFSGVISILDNDGTVLFEAEVEDYIVVNTLSSCNLYMEPIIYCTDPDNSSPWNCICGNGIEVGVSFYTINCNIGGDAPGDNGNNPGDPNDGSPGSDMPGNGGGDGGSTGPGNNQQFPTEPMEPSNFPLLVNEIFEQGDFVDWGDEVILANSFLENDKVNCVYNKLKGLSNTLFNQIIDDHFDGSKEAHILFEIGNIPDENGFSYNARTYPSYPGGNSNRYYRIKLDTSFVENASTIEIALTIIHESIHAELLERCIQSGLILNITPTGLGSYSFVNFDNPSPLNGLTIFDALVTYYMYYGGNGNPQWNHDLFNVLGHRQAMIQNLLDIHPWLDDTSNPFVNKIYSDNQIYNLQDFFQHFSWEGLEETQQYISLPNTEKTKKEYVRQFARSNYTQNCE